MRQILLLLLCEYNLSPHRQRSASPAMGGAWLVRCMWLGMLANKMSYDALSSNIMVVGCA
eukprot:scaffold166133_cov30-Tisochrysis_lutea.AAC.1